MGMRHLEINGGEHKSNEADHHRLNVGAARHVGDQKTEESDESDEHQGGTCSICLGDLSDHTDGPPQYLGCFHTFHKKCIGQWLDSNHAYNRKCPECKFNVAGA